MSSFGAPMKNLSVSKIEKYLLCPMQFKNQYIDKIPSPSVGHMIAGKAIHAVIEESILQVAKTGRHMDAKTMDDHFEPTWDRMIREEEEKPWFLCWSWDPADPEEKVKREYRALIPIVCRDVFPTLRPYILDGEPVVEHRVEYELRSRVGPFKMLGFADLLEAGGILQDWKSTKKVSERAKRMWYQFAAYSILYYPIVGEEDLRCEKIFLVRGEDPHVERVPFTVGAKHREYFVEMAAQIWESIYHGLYLKVTDTWACKPDRCAFWSGCQGEVAKHDDSSAGPKDQAEAGGGDPGPAVQVGS